MSARGIIAVLALAWSSAALAAPADTTATATVDALHASFIAVMKQAESLGFEGRVKVLAAPVGEAFDLNFMAIKSLGLGGRDLDAAAWRRWVAAFGRLIVSNYARRFTSYSGQRFESLGEEPAPQGQVVVRSRVVRSHDPDVQLDYRLRRTPEGWKIVDIYARGTTSLLSLRRAEFSSLLEREGFEELVASVEKKAAGE